MSPNVSVIIPAYNSEGFLRQAIDSVYAQTFAPAEVLVVNDGSTDGTEQLLRRLAGDLPSTFRWISKPNGGPASARNAGLKVVGGDFVAFLDHDDLWHGEKLARQVEHFAREPNLAVSFTAANAVAYELVPSGSLRRQTTIANDDNGDLVDKRVTAPGFDATASYRHAESTADQDELLRVFMSHSPVGSVSTVMVRRDAFDRVPPFDERLLVVDDWLMFLNMAAVGLKFGHLPDELVEYRWYGGNTSGDALKIHQDISAMFDLFLATNELPARTRKLIRPRRWCARWHLVTAIDELHAGHKQRARSHILRAACVHPPSVRPGWVRILTGVFPPSY
jgi:glycosyltransferase involved in cell wall biosynthesis